MKTDSRCQVCGLEGESVNHVLFTCSIARQLWVLTRFPSPEEGFNDLSLFSNVHYLLNISQNGNVPSEVRSMFPWILWRIWKNRNTFIYDARSFGPLDSVAKMKEERDLWFLAQQINEQIDLVPVDDEEMREEIWKPPIQGFLKCNIGGFWDKKKKIGGCAWVLRDDRGLVLLHSRRSFANMNSKDEVLMQSLIWSIDSMVSLHFSNVVFASQAFSLIKTVNKPKDWPAFSHQSDRLLMALEQVSGWQLCFECAASNRGAGLIALSALSQVFSQSYMALSYPVWLSVLFENEKVLSSV